MTSSAVPAHGNERHAVAPPTGAVSSRAGEEFATVSARAQVVRYVRATSAERRYHRPDGWDGSNPVSCPIRLSR